MPQETLDFAVVQNGQTVNLHVVLTVSATANADGSYTVTDATGTFGSLHILGLAPLNTDGSDNKVFLDGRPIVDLGGLTFVTDGTPGGATDLGTGNGGGTAADINLFYTGTYIQPNNVYAIDTAVTTTLPDPQTTYDPSCFCRGTLILTDRGEVRVEALAIGDRVVGFDGRARPIVWLGRQTLATRFADPVRAWPIRVKAGALADNVPARDLRLSADHALFVDGVLIQAGALVNGTSIVRETPSGETLDYYHVELEDHALILAEGAPAESFVDTVDRLGFDNWAEHQALYPEGRDIEELPYPRAKSHRQTPVETRERLARRAAALAPRQALAA